MPMLKTPPLLGMCMLLLASPWDMAHSAPSAPRVAARNPVIWSDVPDPSTPIRVGDTYYMSSTTMHMSPGLPIMKSKDLVNWQMAGYVYDTLQDSDDLALRNGKSAYGRGSWASSLQFHKGTFYVTTFSYNTGRTHVYTSKDIEKGPWKAVSFAPSLHDHGLFFDDDGRAYMTHGSGDIRLTELAADASGIKAGGTDQLIIKDASLAAGPNVGLKAEGSHLHKINGKYYIFLITWPKGGMRTELVFRADRITGPYEGKVALRDQGVAQGGIVETADGKWFALLFRDSGAVGRIPYLVPVTWQDGWPLMGIDGKVPETLEIAAANNKIPALVASDDFTRKAGEPALPMAWQWNHNPDHGHWSVAERPGYLRLTNGRVSAGLMDARNTLTQRTFGPTCAADVSLDVRNMKDGDVAGLAALQKNHGFVGVKMEGGKKSLVMVDAADGSPRELAAIPLAQATVGLKVEMDFRDRKDSAAFSYSLDARNWHHIGQPLKMSYTIPHFMGYRFALFNYASRAAGGFVDVDFFRVSGSIDAAPRLPDEAR